MITAAKVPAEKSVGKRTRKPANGGHSAAAGWGNARSKRMIFGLG